MKYYGLIFAAILGSSALATVSGPADAAGATYTDTLCPRAIPKVTTFNTDAVAKNYAKLVEDAQAVVDAYRYCTVDAKATVGISYEPTVNYEMTRTAQYLVVLGRLQVASGEPVEAIDSFKAARELATGVAQWIPDAEAGSISNGRGGNGASRNTDRQPSQYKDAATDIKTAADAELAKLGAIPSAAPSAQPSP